MTSTPEATYFANCFVGMRNIERESVCVLIHAHIHRGKRDKINTTAAQAHHSLSLSLSLSSHTHPLALTDIMHDIRKYSQQENERKEGEKH